MKAPFCVVFIMSFVLNWWRGGSFRWRKKKTHADFQTKLSRSCLKATFEPKFIFRCQISFPLIRTKDRRLAFKEEISFSTMPLWKATGLNWGLINPHPSGTFKFKAWIKGWKPTWVPKGHNGRSKLTSKNRHQRLTHCGLFGATRFNTIQWFRKFHEDFYRLFKNQTRPKIILQSGWLSFFAAVLKIKVTGRKYHKTALERKALSKGVSSISVLLKITTCHRQILSL